MASKETEQFIKEARARRHEGNVAKGNTLSAYDVVSQGIQKNPYLSEIYAQDMNTPITEPVGRAM